MIYSDSRYSNPVTNPDGTIPKAWDAKRQEYHVVIRRNFPVYSTKFYLYEWKDGDRLDNLANKFLGNSQYWWKIMDLNPEIINPTTIVPGTLLRFPSA
jgi:hypothetical protein